jgi:hypothetical protein
MLIGAAVELAEKQIRDGSASAQVLTHYLKLASIRGQLENEKLRREIRLLEARAEAAESAKRVEELYTAALDAMRSYAGQTPDEEDDYYDD